MGERNELRSTSIGPNLDFTGFGLGDAGQEQVEDTIQDLCSDALVIEIESEDEEQK